MQKKMVTISHCFENLRSQKKCALIPFIMAGDPDLTTTAAAIRVLDRHGADFIEVGVPYSDPLADGPVIHAAATRAIGEKVNLRQVLTMLREITPEIKAPLILFTYYNLILHRGVQSFLADIVAAGVRGLVVPDLPLEEAKLLIQMASAFGVEVILLVAPTSSPERIAAITAQSQGFVYLVSVTGVTGMRSQIENRVHNILINIRNVTDKAIGVGFGISTPEQAQQVKQWGADAVIVGSAFVKQLGENTPQVGLQGIEKLCCQLKAAISPVVRKSSLTVSG
jgi:tryptophan synthase alpha chain